MTHGRRLLVAIVAVAISAACASRAKPLPAGPITPKFPEYPRLEIPANLRVTQDIRDRHEQAWRRLQTGDLRTANREFNDTLRRSGTFYPAETGLGFVALAGRDFKQAAQRFSAALLKNDRYLPAWLGLADAEVGLGRDAEAISALEHALALDPKLEALKDRVELLRFKEVQALIAGGQRARQAGRVDEAERTLTRALALAPSSAIILRELALAESARNAADAAEAHARRAVEIDPKDAESYAALGAVLEAQERYREAAAEYGRAVAIDPRPTWRDRSTALREKANLSAIPAEFRDLSSAATVSRGQVAALIGTRLEGLVDGAPKRVTAVATDVRTHWASPWILPVTQAGIMEIQPNHTFQPGATVRRRDLARVVSQLLAIVAAERHIDLARWRAARPRFADLPGTNVFYNAAALAVASGAMDAVDGYRFEPARLLTGAELIAAIDRIEQLAGR
jgi:tetratricopeptide (TPR) repeat protein